MCFLQLSLTQTPLEAFRSAQDQKALQSRKAQIRVISLCGASHRDGARTARELHSSWKEAIYCCDGWARRLDPLAYEYAPRALALTDTRTCKRGVTLLNEPQSSQKQSWRSKENILHTPLPKPWAFVIVCDWKSNICFECLLSVSAFLWLSLLQTDCNQVLKNGGRQSTERADGLSVLYLHITQRETCTINHCEKKTGVPFRRPIQRENTHCVTLCDSRLRSALLLTTARSPPRSEHCCRASVQLNSPGTIWKQCEDSAWYTPSFGQWGEAGGGQKN